VQPDSDWRGRDITGFWPHIQDILTRTIVPASIENALAAAREGQGVAGVATEFVGGVLGVNVREQPAGEALDVLARQQFKKRWEDLEPSQRQYLRQTYPELWQRAVAQASQRTQQAEALRNQLRAEQEASDQRLLRGEISWKQWRDALHDRRTRERAALNQIYGAQRLSRDPILQKYNAQVEAATRPDGTIDWDQIDSWLADQPEEVRAYIRRNTNFGSTPLVEQYLDLREQANPLLKQYRSIPAFLGLSVSEGEQVLQLVNEARALAQATGAPYRAAAARLAQERDVPERLRLALFYPQKYRNPQRSIFWRQHPILEMVYGDLTPEFARPSKPQVAMAMAPLR
jgi:hypothetical protein